MSKVIDDLHAAFAGESQANRKYTAFARQADAAGHPQVAKLFRAAAAAETVHAINHFKAMGEVKSTAENLQAAIGGENYEVMTMYPEFIADAKTENDKGALRTFEWAWEVEKIHEGLFRKALANLEQPAEPVDYWVCPICGYTHEGPEPPEKCPVCGVKGERFEFVD
jgi:rubrerythrin